jgi:hypothetical protein
VFGVREEGLTVSSIRRLKGDRENPARKWSWQERDRDFLAEQ